MGKRSRRGRVVSWSLIVLGTLVPVTGLTVVISHLVIVRSAGGYIVQDPGDTPSAQCAIVLGAKVHADGTPAPMLTDRLEIAIELYRVNVMLDYVWERGVPDEDVFTDHAGFDTYDTMYAQRGAKQSLEVAR